MSNIVTPEECCDPLPPVAEAGEVRQFPQVPTTAGMTGGGGTSGPDTEIISSGWICDPATDTYHRTITPYVDGVAGAAQEIDSGIACSEAAPVERELSQIELCIAGEIQVQFYESVDGANPAPIGGLIPTGQICGVIQGLPDGAELPVGATTLLSTLIGATIVKNLVVTNEEFQAGTTDASETIVLTYQSGQFINIESASSRSHGREVDQIDITGMSVTTGALSNADLSWEI